MKPLLRPTIVFVSLLAIQHSVFAFNSDEHKVIGDTGASRVVVPAGVVLPNNVELVDIDKQDYIQVFKDAKRLAVGYDTNNPNDYNPNATNI